MLDTNDYDEPNPVINWEHLHQFFEERYKSRHQWIFRGMSNSNWNLESTLERSIYAFALDKSAIPKIKCDIDKQKLLEEQSKLLHRGLNHPRTRSEPISIFQLEGGLLKRFKRQYYHFSHSAPKNDNHLEWFALMRHHGAPTRLLDWTYSFYIAVHFALEKAEGMCSVWAFNTDPLKQRIGDLIKRKANIKTRKLWESDSDITDHKTFNALFIQKKPIAMVAAINPYRLNERLVVQQGVFLCPGDLSRPFEDNLKEVLVPDKKNNLIKLNINLDIHSRRDVLERLSRMNISNASLYPGLDGFASSLRLLVRPDKLTPDDTWPTENRQSRHKL